MAKPLALTSGEPAGIGPDIAIMAWLRRKPVALRFPDVSVVASINTGRGKIARWCGSLGRGLALAAAVVGLAGPRWPDPGQRIPTEGIAILLVVDVSNSMNEEDFLWQEKPITRILRSPSVTRAVARQSWRGSSEKSGIGAAKVARLPLALIPKVTPCGSSPPSPTMIPPSLLE